MREEGYKFIKMESPIQALKKNYCLETPSRSALFHLNVLCLSTQSAIEIRFLIPKPFFARVRADPVPHFVHGLIVILALAIKTPYWR